MNIWRGCASVKLKDSPGTGTTFSPLAANHPNTSSPVSPPIQCPSHPPTDSSNDPGASHNRSGSTCLLSATSSTGSRDARSCGRIRRNNVTKAPFALYCSPTCAPVSKPRDAALREEYQGATMPLGGLPQKSLISLYVLSRIAVCCSKLIEFGFSCEYPCRPISCPASRIIAHSVGKVSRLWPGINQVVFMLYFSKRRRRRRTPTVPAKRPG